MNHIDKKVIYTTPLPKVQIMARSARANFCVKNADWRNFSSGETIRWAKFSSLSKNSSLSPDKLSPDKVYREATGLQKHC